MSKFMENKDTLYCNVKPLRYNCRVCLDIQQQMDLITSCKQCPYNLTRYEIISFNVGLFGDKAIVLSEGKPIKVDISRIYNIRKGE